MLNGQTLALEAQIPVGQHPHTCVLGAGNVNLYVSNWGSRSVSIVDTRKGRRLQDIPVGLRPNDMALARDGRLFVACSGDNTVHVIDTKVVEKVTPEATPTRRPSEAAREIISTSLYPDSPEGSTPDAVAVSPDGKTLFVANADNNNVAVVNIADPRYPGSKGSSRWAGIPARWPSARTTSTLFVANGRGCARGPISRRKSSEPRKLHKGPRLRPHRAHVGGLDFVHHAAHAGRDAAFHGAGAPQLALHARALCGRAPTRSECVIPDTVGQPCPIKYVLYIIKENRTYDQVLGDFKDAAGRPAGNGDPNLAIYGESVTPNQHRLAREYVLLDNLLLQRRGQPGRPQLVPGGHRDRSQAAHVDGFLFRAWHRAGQR